MSRAYTRARNGNVAECVDDDGFAQEDALFLPKMEDFVSCGWDAPPPPPLPTTTMY